MKYLFMFQNCSNVFLHILIMLMFCTMRSKYQLVLFSVSRGQLAIYFLILVRNPCEPNPCSNDGLCTHNEDVNVTCICKSNFNGPLCNGMCGSFTHLIK